MLIKELKLRNFLSFGPESQNLELGPLNVFIGPNGSGKSNLIEAIHLLQAAPKDLAKPIRELGGVDEWIWKGGEGGAEATIDAVVELDDAIAESDQSKRPFQPKPLHYHLKFMERGFKRLHIVNERIEDEVLRPGYKKPYVYFTSDDGLSEIGYWESEKEAHRMEWGYFDPESSILAQVKYPGRFPEITYLGRAFGNIRIYRDWPSGRYTPQRLWQQPALPKELLEEDASNLGWVLQSLLADVDAKKKLLKYLSRLYDGISGLRLPIEDDTDRIRVSLEEENVIVPATRLSEGTLRYLCLLAILCHPKNSTLVCIEEPELGLHPDIMLSLVDVLRDASKRMQIIVTTHSSTLVDALTDVPESVFVTEKHDGQTTIERLSRAELGSWIERYSLGELWTKGEIGGNRW